MDQSELVKAERESRAFWAESGAEVPESELLPESCTARGCSETVKRLSFMYVNWVSMENLNLNRT